MRPICTGERGRRAGTSSILLSFWYARSTSRQRFSFLRCRPTGASTAASSSAGGPSAPCAGASSGAAADAPASPSSAPASAPLIAAAPRLRSKRSSSMSSAEVAST